MLQEKMGKAANRVAVPTAALPQCQSVLILTPTSDSGRPHGRWCWGDSRERGPFSSSWNPWREPTNWCSMPGFDNALLRKTIIWFCRVSVVSSRFCATATTTVIRSGESLKYSARFQRRQRQYLGDWSYCNLICLTASLPQDTASAGALLCSAAAINVCTLLIEKNASFHVNSQLTWKRTNLDHKPEPQTFIKGRLCGQAKASGED